MSGEAVTELAGQLQHLLANGRLIDRNRLRVRFRPPELADVQLVILTVELDRPGRFAVPGGTENGDQLAHLTDRVLDRDRVLQLDLARGPAGETKHETPFRKLIEVG